MGKRVQSLQPSPSLLWVGFLDFAFWLTRGHGDAGTRGQGERFRNEKIGFFRLNMKNLPLKGGPSSPFPITKCRPDISRRQVIVKN
jgi:hypothetical protein